MADPGRVVVHRECFAVAVVRAGLDPLTGRTLSANHVPMAVWAGHLCDLVLAGALRDEGGIAIPTGVLADHPLLRRALKQVTPSLPRGWRWLFGRQAVDINVEAAQTRQWLVDAGLWSRRRTLWGVRWAETDPETPVRWSDGPGDPIVRRRVQDTLIQLAKYGSTGSAELRLARNTGARTPVDAILKAADDIVAWKTTNPTLPGAGTDGMH